MHTMSFRPTVLRSRIYTVLACGCTRRTTTGWTVTVLTGLFLMAPPMLGASFAQTEAESAAVKAATGTPQADALLTAWVAVKDLADGRATGQFEAVRTAELAASYRVSAEQVGAPTLQAMPDNPDPAPVQQVLQTQEVQFQIVTSSTPDGAPGPVGTMSVVQTSAMVPDHVTWTYADGSSDRGFGIPLPGTGAIAVSFGTGVKSLHIYRLRAPDADQRSLEGLWAPALAGATIRPARLTPKDGVLMAKSFYIEEGGTMSIDRITSSSALHVQWTLPTGEVHGIGVLFGTYLAAIAIDPEDHGGVALHYTMGNGPHAISRWVVNGSDGVGKEELVMAQPADASATIDPASANDLEAEVRAIAEALGQDLGNATRWKPTTSQINAISATKADADKLRAYVQTVYAELIQGKPGAMEGQTEILIRGPDLSELAGGYRNKKSHFRPGIDIYGFKFVEPGKDTGMLYDGLIRVNGDWVFIPKAWRAFQ